MIHDETWGNPLVISSKACLKIPSKWRYVARKITNFLWSIFQHAMWLIPRGQIVMRYEIWWDMMRCDEMWWDMMRYDEIWWNMYMFFNIWCQFQIIPKNGTGNEHSSHIHQSSDTKQDLSPHFTFPSLPVGMDTCCFDGTLSFQGPRSGDRT